MSARYAPTTPSPTPPIPKVRPSPTAMACQSETPPSTYKKKQESTPTTHPHHLTGVDQQKPIQHTYSASTPFMRHQNLLRCLNCLNNNLMISGIVNMHLPLVYLIAVMDLPLIELIHHILMDLGSPIVRSCLCVVLYLVALSVSKHLCHVVWTRGGGVGRGRGSSQEAFIATLLFDPSMSAQLRRRCRAQYSLTQLP